MSDLRILATDLGFPEGPVAMADGSVIVSEIRGKKVTRISADGSKSEVGHAAGGPNGCAIGPDGALYVCNNGGITYPEGGFLSIGPSPEYQGGYIQKIDLKTGETRQLYTHCGENKLSAPNDIVFDTSGGFYFTDLGKRRRRDKDHGGLYYALPDGSRCIEVSYPILSPNGVALSPDGRVLYVADTEPARLLSFDVAGPGQIKATSFPDPYGGRVLCGLPGYQRFDSLAITAAGDICIATFMTGYISVISPAGKLLDQIKVPDVFPTNICFGGHDMKTAFITLSASGRLMAMDWSEPGLKLNFNG